MYLCLTYYLNFTTSAMYESCVINIQFITRYTSSFIAYHFRKQSPERPTDLEVTSLGKGSNVVWFISYMHLSLKKQLNPSNTDIAL